MISLVWKKPNADVLFQGMMERLTMELLIALPNWSIEEGPLADPFIWFEGSSCWLDWFWFVIKLGSDCWVVVVGCCFSPGSPDICKKEDQRVVVAWCNEKQMGRGVVYRLIFCWFDYFGQQQQENLCHSWLKFEETHFECALSCHKLIFKRQVLRMCILKKQG